MKKLITITLLVVMLVACAATTVNATTTSTLADDLYALGSTYGMTAADKVKVERYLATYTVTDAEAAAVYEKAVSVAAVFQAAGVTNYSQLTTDQKNQVKSLANEAASIVGVTIVYGNNTVSFYKNGTLIESATQSSGKLAYTGNDIVNLVAPVAIIAIAVIALTSVVVSKRKLANA